MAVTYFRLNLGSEITFFTLVLLQIIPALFLIRRKMTQENNREQINDAQISLHFGIFTTTYVAYILGTFINFY